MSEWRGLHNHDRHITTTSGKRAMCNVEGQHNHDTWCDPKNPCYCCLVAEVEVLRATIERVREAVRCDDANREALDGSWRPWYEPLAPGGRLLVVPVWPVLEALDGTP